MKTKLTISNSGGRSRLIKPTWSAALLPALLLLLAIQPSQAASATWRPSPATGDWNTATNWTPVTVPNGPSDTATFATSSQTSVSLSADTEVNSITYSPGASAFTTTVGDGVMLTVSGFGLVNHAGAGRIQNFVGGGAGLGSYINFINNANVGNKGPINFTLNFNDFIIFQNSSNAGTGVFTLNGPVEIDFYDSSTSGSGTFILNGTEGYAPVIQFFGSSNAGGGSFTLNGNGQGAYCFFNESSTASGPFTINGAENSTNGPGVLIINSAANNATLVANAGLDGGSGGVISFSDDSTGGTTPTRVEVFGNGSGDLTNGNLDISGHTAPGLAVGSIEGSGAVFLGGNNLTVGSNDLSTAFSGKIQGSGGSLTKTGTGQLTLSTANTYTGGTTVSEGTLLVTNRGGSATGTGTVTINAGTLAGTGRISGAVTIGTATSAAILAPGNGARPRTLTILSALTFNAHATYKIDLNSNNVTTDQVVAKGVTINSSALVSIDDLGGSVLPPGTAFTVISNTAATPIAGTFSNLADGSTLTVDSNTYQVSYEGGDGNDLTLTVQ
jgi:autotransporter-associated beta strand protein